MTDPDVPRRVAIVTGGARGLGAVMALALAERGTAVALLASRPSAELDATAEAVGARNGGAVLPLVVDVADREQADAAVAATVRRFGTVHALINNAGRGMRLVSETFTSVPVPFWSVPDIAWSSIVATNVTGPFIMTTAVLPVMLANAHGRIVNVSTSAPTMVRRGYSPYGPSKAALEAMSRAWAADLADTGVTVNLLLPGGAADTDLLPSGPDRRGADGNLLDPASMGPPAVWLCDAATEVTGERFIARHWDATLPLDDAIAAARSPHVVAP